MVIQKNIYSKNHTPPPPYAPPYEEISNDYRDESSKRFEKYKQEYIIKNNIFLYEKNKILMEENKILLMKQNYFNIFNNSIFIGCFLIISFIITSLLFKIILSSFVYIISFIFISLLTLLLTLLISLLFTIILSSYIYKEYDYYKIILSLKKYIYN